MQVRCYDRDDVASFVSTAWPLLAADPLRHTVGLTVLDALNRARTGADRPHEVAALLTVHDAGAVAGALLRTAGRPALVSAVRPEQAVLVDAALATADPQLPGVSGPRPTAEALSAAHLARAGGRVRVDRRLRLFGMAELIPAVGVEGAARRATEADADLTLLAGWMLEFQREALPELGDPRSPVEDLRRALAAGNGVLVWEVDDRPVALAVGSRPIAGMSRIGPVYTPPGDRRHGYGAAVTAAAARWAQDAGARQVVLFVDEANPTTNRLYPRLGFRPVHDVLDLSFTPESTT
jgi:GNAT superfamily N-acetyltransferase